MRVLVNQLGYEPGEQPRLVLRGSDDDSPDQVELRRARTDEVVATASPSRVGHVDDWRDWVFWTAALPALEESGEFVAAVEYDDGTARSLPFRVEPDLRRGELLPSLLSYFRAERCTGASDRADREASFVGEREDVVDVRGGWYDASGDVSTYLSHLSYANYWNPQQIPLVAWSLASAANRLAGSGSDGASTEPATDDQDPLAAELAARAWEEACFGADYLVRVQDDAGYFYQVVFDGWTGDPEQREICAFEGFDGEKTADYEAGFRQGSGVAVAALARCSQGPECGDFGRGRYLDAARTGFEHLQEHNEAYLDDGTENVVDDYCALLAATELAAATGERAYREAASRRVRSLLARQTDEGWFLADGAADGSAVESAGSTDVRPFFHATDEGLPIVALCRYLAAVDPQPDDDAAVPASEVRDALRAYWAFELEVTDEVVNPFGYARQFSQGTDEREPRARFFLPHDNETGYWWLGENARLASLAAAALWSRPHVEDPELAADLDRFAADQRDWILGRNPFDVSMVEGVGRNSEPFVPDAVHTPGGIVNGVTAGVDGRGDRGIAFCPDEYADDPEIAWRWSEQWVPHAAWFLQVLVA